MYVLLKDKLYSCPRILGILGTRDKLTRPEWQLKRARAHMRHRYSNLLARKVWLERTWSIATVIYPLACKVLFSRCVLQRTRPNLAYKNPTTIQSRVQICLKLARARLSALDKFCWVNLSRVLSILSILGHEYNLSFRWPRSFGSLIQRNRRETWIYVKFLV